MELQANMLPILLAFVAMILIREGISVKGILRQRKLLLYIVNTIIVIVISGIHYVWLCNQLEFDSMSLHVGLVEAGNFYQNILNFPALVMGLLGWSKTSSLFSISTFKCCALLVYNCYFPISNTILYIIKSLQNFKPLYAIHCFVCKYK